jgi:hypothetical protein
MGINQFKKTTDQLVSQRWINWSHGVGSTGLTTLDQLVSWLRGQIFSFVFSLSDFFRLSFSAWTPV